MMRIVNNEEVRADNKLTEVSCLQENELIEQSLATAITHPNPTTQLLLSSKLMPHRPEAGLNPLVDAAAYLFSMMGRLKHIKSYPDLSKLHEELVQEIERFQETIQTYHYNETYLSEYLPIACYALCVTLDDVISNMPWGNQGKWDEFSLVISFNQEPLSHKSFLIILERLIRDPAIYIDVMEFMYICLSLGFKSHHQAAEFNHEQLEQIMNSLYKRIRTYRGNFNKMLSPFSIRPAPLAATHRSNGWKTVLVGGFLVLILVGACLLKAR